MSQIQKPTKAQMTEAGWLAPKGMTSEQWARAGQQIATVVRASQWWIGDWINYGEKRWGEKYEQAVKITGLSYSTLADAARLAGRFEFTRRRVNLSWSHHREVEGLPEDDQEHWLNRAEAEGLSQKQLRKEIARANRKEFSGTFGETMGQPAGITALEEGEEVRTSPPLHAVPSPAHQSIPTRITFTTEMEGDRLARSTERLIAAAAKLGFEVASGQAEAA